MNRFFYLVLFILNSCWFSDELSSQTFISGASFGISGSQIDGDKYGGYNKLNLHGGLWVQRDLDTRIAYRIEIRYNEKGSLAKEKSSGIILYKARLRYVEIPLELVYKINPKINVVAGLLPGILLSVYEEELGNDFSDINSYHRVDPSAMLGLIYDINEYWSFIFHFEYSLLTIKKDVSTNPIYYGGAFNNKVMSFGLGYKFH